jgi:hypothetical protein
MFAPFLVSVSYCGLNSYPGTAEESTDTCNEVAWFKYGVGKVSTALAEPSAGTFATNPCCGSEVPDIPLVPKEKIVSVNGITPPLRYRLHELLRS